MDLTDIYRTFHPKTTEHTFFSSTHGTFSRIDHILGHKSSLGKFKKIEIISTIFSDHNAMRSRYQLQDHLTPVRMGIIRKSTNNKCWRRCAEKGTLLHCWWKCKLIQPLWRTVWRFLKKLKIELPYDPALPLLGIYPEKTIIQKESCTTMFIAGLVK